MSLFFPTHNYYKNKTVHTIDKKDILYVKTDRYTRLLQGKGCMMLKLLLLITCLSAIKIQCIKFPSETGTQSDDGCSLIQTNPQRKPFGGCK